MAGLPIKSGEARMTVKSGEETPENRWDSFFKRFSLSGVYGVDGAVCELLGKGERLTCLSVSASLCSHS